MNYDLSVPLPSSAIPLPVISKPVSSSAPKLKLKETGTSDTATVRCPSANRPKRQCSAEEIEQKKQEALRRRQTLKLKM